MWSNFVEFWYSGISNSLDNICVFVAVALLGYSLIKGQKRDSGFIISISFVGWLLLATFLTKWQVDSAKRILTEEEMKDFIARFMIVWFLSLAIKDVVFGAILRRLDKKSRLPIPYYIQSAITFLTLIALNRGWFSEANTEDYLVPAWSLLYAFLMVVKLTICYSEIKHDGARPIPIFDTFLLFLSRNARKGAHAFVGFSHEPKAKQK